MSLLKAENGKVLEEATASDPEPASLKLRQPAAAFQPSSGWRQIGGLLNKLILVPLYWVAMGGVCLVDLFGNGVFAFYRGLEDAVNEAQWADGPLWLLGGSGIVAITAVSVVMIDPETLLLRSIWYCAGVATAMFLTSAAWLGLRGAGRFDEETRARSPRRADPDRKE